MKMIFFTLSFCLLILPSRAATSIIELIPDLAKNPSIKIVGWDQVAGINDKISNLDKPANLALGMTLADIVKVLADQTDYSSIGTKEGIVILPKENGSKYNTPISRRVLVVPTISNLSVDEALKKISSANGPNFLLLNSHSIVPNVGRAGTISLSAGKYTGYEILNQIAFQLKAKIWIINNGMNTDSQGNTIYPIWLGGAEVAFFQ